MDLRLPKKNGIEILNELTNHESENIRCNVIVISGDAELRHTLDNMKQIYSILGHRHSCSPERIKSSLISIIKSANRFSSSSTSSSIFYIEDKDINKAVSPKHFINGMIICLKK